MKLPAALTAAMLVTLAVVFGASSEKPADVEIARLSESNWEQFAPNGKEVDAIYGDYVLRNQYLTAVIAQPKDGRNANMTVRDVGGALIDLTVRDSQSDQLSAFYPGRRKFPYRSGQVISAEGTEVRLQEDLTYSGQAGAVTVVAEAAEGRPRVEVTYRLAADAPYLTVVSRMTNTGADPLTVELEDDLRADGGKEDMVKSPNGLTDLFWIHDRYWEQAYGIDAPRLQIQANSNARNSVLKYQQTSGDSSIVLSPGQSFEWTRRIFPGNNLIDVRAVATLLNDQAVYPITVMVRDGAGQSIPRARVEVRRDDQVLGEATTNRDGQVQVSLSAGEYQAKVTSLGVEVGNSLPMTVRESSDDQLVVFDLENYKPGRVVAQITNAQGNPIPCKVEFRPKMGTPRPNFGPDSADFAVNNLRYAPQGQFEQLLPAGYYDVIISHGPEYDAIFTELTISPGQTAELRGRLVRTVQTPGWISSDFHSHSSPSGDNTASQLGRVLNLVAEHIEFAPCTEHNRISTYEPHIERLGIGQFLATVSGLELTGRPLPLNHQNAFPMKRKPHTQDGGAPQTDSDPAVQIERLALWDNRSRKLIQVNHPDMGWMFYDRNGDGEPDAGLERMFAQMDVVEIHPIPNVLRLEPNESLPGRKGNNRIFNWLQLINQGFRIPGVVNTDAHYNFHGSGGLRNWIQSSTDEPAEIDPMEMVEASEEGRVIMSNGPYLEVSLSERGQPERVTAGQDLRATSGKVVLHARVQCPNWFDIDRVFVLVNGRQHPIHDYSRQKTPGRFRSGVVKFDEQMDLELDSDTHIIVIAAGEKSTLGPVLGPSWGKQQPTALSNPIFIDIDGNGFQPNKDTLGHPLPVKAGTRRN